MRPQADLNFDKNQIILAKEKTDEGLMQIHGRRRASGGVSGTEIVIEAAWLYYHDGLNQGEIADRLDVSRATIVNYLQEARERGIIRITLADDAFLGHKLSQDLCSRFGLQAAYVIPASGLNDEAALVRVARGTATWLPSLLEPGDTLGIAWGRTIYEVAEALEQGGTRRDLSVVQLVGSMATPYGFTAEICSAHLAQRLGGRVVNLHAPAVLTDPDLAARLRAEPIIKAQLDALAHCNKAMFAAGSVMPESHIVSSGIASLEDLDWYVRAGARGVLCGRFVDGKGRHIQGPLDDRIIGATLDKLLGLETGLLVSVGDDKVDAMIAVINGGYATHLVTSAQTAEAILAR
jgi:deoxyribonucleoside regulator